MDAEDTLLFLIESTDATHRTLAMIMKHLEEVKREAYQRGLDDAAIKILGG